MRFLLALFSLNKLIDILFLALDSLVVMLLWNYVMPDITAAGYFHLQEIDYWHAAGLLALTAFLIRGKL